MRRLHRPSSPPIGPLPVPNRAAEVVAVLTIWLAASCNHEYDAARLSGQYDTTTPHIAIPDSLHASLTVTDTAWTKGVQHGEPIEEFGRITDIAFDGGTHYYLLDGASNLIRVFSTEGRAQHVYGAPSPGWPGFADPVAIVHDGISTLYVLDSTRGLAAISTDRDPIRHMKSTTLDFFGQDLCLIHNRLYVLGWHDGSTIHEYSTSGEHLRSFGDAFGPSGHPVQRIVSAQGKIACLPHQGVVVVVSRLLPELLAYSTRDTSLLWSARIPNFSGVRIDLNPSGMPLGTYRMTVPEGGAAENAVLRPLTPNTILSQSVLVAPDGHHTMVSTAIFSVATGRPLFASKALPMLVPVSSQRAVIVREVPFPMISVVDLTLGSP